MDELIAFVKAQFPQVGSVVLYPALWETVNQSPHDANRLHAVRKQLRASGWLATQMVRNPSTGEMENRWTRLAS